MDDNAKLCVRTCFVHMRPIRQLMTSIVMLIITTSCLCAGCGDKWFATSEADSASDDECVVEIS